MPICSLVRGDEVDARADLFACGALPCELLTGGSRFQRATAAETLRAILKEDPPELTSTGTHPQRDDRGRDRSTPALYSDLTCVCHRMERRGGGGSPGIDDARAETDQQRIIRR
jgi:hypothetical protein